MSKRTRHALIYLLTSFIAIVIGLELLLRLFDPLGVNEYYQFLKWSSENRVPHPTGYSYIEGVYEVAGYDVTITDEGLRVMPAHNNVDCTIAFIGDSVTFGIGVGDTDAFAWQIAEAIPGVQFINTAKGGYDSQNLSASVHYYDADAYIYTIVVNDTTRAMRFYPIEYDISIALRNYRHWLQRQTQAYEHDADNYSAILGTFEEVPVLFASYREHLAYDIAQSRFDVLLLPEVTQVSIADPHISVNGHAVVADYLLPHVQQLIDDNC